MSRENGNLQYSTSSRERAIARVTSNKKQVDVAEATGYSIGMVSLFENHRRENPYLLRYYEENFSLSKVEGALSSCQRKDGQSMN